MIRSSRIRNQVRLLALAGLVGVVAGVGAIVFCVASLAQLIEPLARYLIGWRDYFGFCQTPRVRSNLGAWIRRRLRMYLWRQWKSGRNRFKELRRCGVRKFRAAVAVGSPSGFWRMSGHPAVQQALRNAYFDSMGLPRLAASENA
jgi:RNA-directed DNA polymerase